MTEVVIGVDPGKTTGWCRLEKNGTYQTSESRGLEETWQFLNLLQGQMDLIFVVEDYKIRPKVNHAWDTPVAVKVIGAIEYACSIRGFPLIMQQPAIKPVGYGYAGLDYKPKSRHKSVHMDDATAHAYFYGVNTNFIKPKGKSFRAT